MDDLRLEKIANEIIETPRFYKLKVTIVFTQKVIASSLDEAMDYIMDTCKDVYSIEEAEEE